MAKFLIVLAAALLQANAGPLDFNPISLAFKGPKMGLDIAQRVVGGVQGGLVDNGMPSFLVAPLGMVQSGLAAPVNMMSGLESKMPAFELPSFSGLTGGAGADNQGFGGMMSNIFALPQKFVGQATDMFGKGQELTSGFTSQLQSSMNGINSQIQGSVGKLQESIAELQGKISTEELIAMIKDNAAKAQEKTQGALEGVKGQVKEQIEAAQKKIQEMQQKFAPQAQGMVKTIIEDLQKQAKEAAAAGETEVATKVQEQMKQVIEHANGLMGQMQSAKMPEEVQKIADKFSADFSALYEKAKKQ